MFLRYDLGLLTNLRSHKALREGFEISKGPSDISERVLRFQGSFKEVFENPEELLRYPFRAHLGLLTRLRSQEGFLDFRGPSVITGRVLRSQGGCLDLKGAF